MINSELIKNFLFKIKVRNDNVLISKPIQQLIHELEEIMKKILNINKKKKINLELLIKKKGFYLYKWSMNSLALLDYFFLKKKFNIF